MNVNSVNIKTKDQPIYQEYVMYFMEYKRYIPIINDAQEKKYHSLLVNECKQPKYGIRNGIRVGYLDVDRLPLYAIIHIAPKNNSIDERGLETKFESIGAFGNKIYDYVEQAEMVTKKIGDVETKVYRFLGDFLDYNFLKTIRVLK